MLEEEKEEKKVEEEDAEEEEGKDANEAGRKRERRNYTSHILH